MEVKLNIEEILEAHREWRYNEEGGSRADLRGADLRGADLRGADLRGADLCGADLCGANLCGANLCGANLCGANLHHADLCGANLWGANLHHADLCGANLCGADLHHADLCGANLWSLVGNKSRVKSFQIEEYDITYTKGVLQIGCERHDIKEWFNFDDEKISNMESGALEWWNKWKDTIKQIIEMSPAE